MVSIKKIIIFVLIVIFLALSLYAAQVALGGAIIGGIFNPPIEKGKMETIFAKDYELLCTTTNYLAKSNYDSIYIPSTMESGEMSNAGKPIKIDDAGVVTAVQTLKKRGYSVIGKDGNTIYFQRWSNLDNSRGITYSINGDDPILQFLTKLEPLSKPKWYYYEEDYNEWRVSNNSISSYITGTWDIQYTKTRGAGNASEDDLPQKLYGTDINHDGKLIFNTDGTFSRFVNITTGEINKYEGTYILSYDNEILLKYNDGTTSTAKYLPSSQELVYYTWDTNQIPIDEYYAKRP